MLQQRNTEMKELQREMSDTFWPRARLLNCLALCCRAEKKRMSGGRKEERINQKTHLIKKKTIQLNYVTVNTMKTQFSCGKEVLKR